MDFSLDAASALRAGDDLPFACAEAACAQRMATLDKVPGRKAGRLKIEGVGLVRCADGFDSREKMAI